MQFKSYSQNLIAGMKLLDSNEVETSIENGFL